MTAGDLQCTLFTQPPATTTVTGDYRKARRAAVKPDRANPTSLGIEADRDAADFPFELPELFFDAFSSAAYGP